MKNKIYYRAHTQYENYGDLVINRNILKLMRMHGELCIDIRGVPDFFVQGLEINDREMSFSRFFLFKILFDSLFSNSKVYFFTKPGHVEYQDKPTGLFRNAINTAAYFLMFILGVKICRFGGSIGHSDFISNILESIKGKLYHKYVVRDSGSLEIAKFNRYRNVTIASDLAMFQSLNGENVNKSKENKSGVFSFRDTIDFYKVKSLKTSLEELGYFIDGVIQVDRDFEFMSTLFPDSDISRYRSSIHLEEMLNERYSMAKFIVSNRLHVLLIAMSKGVIPIAFVGDKDSKIIHIFKDLGLESHLIMDNTSVPALLERINYIINTPKDYTLIFDEKRKVNEMVFESIFNSSI